MTTPLLVSIITPTFPGREPQLIGRCIPSVQAQRGDFLVEHIIVSDRNPGLIPTIMEGQADWSSPVTLVQINETWRNPISERCIGAIPWAHGSLMAMGDYVGFLADDDELLPHHVQRHLDTLERTGADASVSQVLFKAHGVDQFIVGSPDFAHGHIDTTGIFARIHCLAVANWSTTSQEYAEAGDYRLVRDWINGGLSVAHIPEVTCVHHDGWVIGQTGRPDRPR